MGRIKRFVVKEERVNQLCIVEVDSLFRSSVWVCDCSSLVKSGQLMIDVRLGSHGYFQPLKLLQACVCLYREKDLTTAFLS